jgi:ribonuclease P protein component
LEKITRYTLGKEQRLKSRKEIELLFKAGKSISIYPFRILYLFQETVTTFPDNGFPANNDKLQAGFTVSSRNFKKAVDRNRIKRLMREAYRLQKHELFLLPALNNYRLTIFFIYTGKELPEYKLVFEKIGDAFNRLTRFTNEKK